MKVNLKDKRREPLSMPRWYLLVMVCVSLVALAGINIAYTSYVDGQRAEAEREADKRWCDLLTTLDSAYSATPPTTAVGRNVADAVRKLRLSLQCPSPPETE